MKNTLLFLATAVCCCFLNCTYPAEIQAPDATRYIRISPDNSSYFSFSDGTPYIPVGINMINPSGRNNENPDSAFMEIGQWMKNLSENGGNYIRIWLSPSFWDIEETAGKYSE